MWTTSDEFMTLYSEEKPETRLTPTTKSDILSAAYKWLVRQFLKTCPAVIVFLSVMYILAPYVYNQRGYYAVGGEVIVAIIMAVLTYGAVEDLLEVIKK